MVLKVSQWQSCHVKQVISLLWSTIDDNILNKQIKLSFAFACTLLAKLRTSEVIDITLGPNLSLVGRIALTLGEWSYY